MEKEHFIEIEHALLELEQPSLWLNQLLEKPWFRKPPFSELFQLSKTEQSPKHHPEGDAWKHTMLVVNEAAKVKHQSSNPRAFMWGAFLHDIGKPETTKRYKGRITSYNHDAVGAIKAEKFLQYFHEPEDFIQITTAYVRWHMMLLYVLKDLPFGDFNQMQRDIDAKEIALLGWCDRMGRLNANEAEERKDIDRFLEKVTYLDRNIKK
jgi:putative nucleotidyltransferase with HDIG domain